MWEWCGAGLREMWKRRDEEEEEEEERRARRYCNGDAVGNGCGFVSDIMYVSMYLPYVITPDSLLSSAAPTRFVVAVLFVCVGWSADGGVV